MEKETKQQRQIRKSMYITYVLSKNHGGANEEELVKEAEQDFEKKNPLK